MTRLFITLGVIFIVVGPFMFWMYWDMFFEHKLSTAEPPTRA